MSLSQIPDVIVVSQYAEPKNLAAKLIKAPVPGSKCSYGYLCAASKPTRDSLKNNKRFPTIGKTRTREFLKNLF
jgi:hypothetical protein